MKITWGHKLIFVFLLFGCMMSYMVFRSFGTRVDLVSEAYYEEELEYQKLIDGAGSVNRIGPALKLSQLGSLVSVSLAENATVKLVSGTAWFYSVTDSNKDKKVLLRPTDSPMGQLGQVKLEPGRYIAKLSWTNEDGIFYTEDNLTIE